MNLSKLNSIINGWSNIIWKDKSVEVLAHTRANICAACSSNMMNICMKCICPLPAKCRSTTEKCPLGKWSL